MKKALFLLLVLVLLAMPLRSAESVADKERDVKEMLNRVSSSMLKVVGENGKRYVATGIAIDADLVITTNQLLQQPLRRITVETAKGDSYPARLAGQDRQTGIALLRLERRVLTPITVAADSGETGDWAALVGAFYDRFPAIVQGLVSSVGRDGLILNAAVAPGAPGGAVINRDGQLIGVIRGAFGVAFSPDYSYTDHSAEFTIRGRRERGENLCFAVPVQLVKTVVGDLKRFGRVHRAWLGVTFNTLDPTRIDEISRNSPAATAGLREGDEIVAVNGRKLQDLSVLGRLVQNAAPDQELRLEVLRDRRPFQVKLRLAVAPDDVSASPLFPFPAGGMGPGGPVGPGAPADLGALPEIENFVFEFSGSRRLGIEMVELTSELARKFQVAEGNGLLISRVNEGGVARKAGLKAGDVIVRVSGGAVPRVIDLHQALNGLRDGEAALLELYRDGQLRKFSVVPATKLSQGQQWEGMSDRMRQASEFMKKAWLDRDRNSSPPPPPPDRNGAFAAERRQQEKALKRSKTQLQSLDQEKNRLPEERRRQVAESIRRLQEEIRRIEEEIRQSDAEGGNPT
jgi:S1-C subfamily serine protease